MYERNGGEGDEAVRKVYAEVRDIWLASFDDWWTDTRRALANGRPAIIYITELIGEDGNIDTARLDHLWGTGKYQIPIIPRGTSLKSIERKLAEEENMATIKNPGPQFPLRVLTPQPIEKLKASLQVWDLKKQHPDWTSEQIAAEADIATHGDRRAHSFASPVTFALLTSSSIMSP